MAKKKMALTAKKGRTRPNSTKSAATGSRKPSSVRATPKTTKRKPSSRKGNPPASTLKDRVEQAAEHKEPSPTTAESEAVRFAISVPGLLDEVREEAFVELGGVVQRKLAKHGVHLTQAEAANVAWWIVGHPDDMPDA
jgi:hypothetical protein